MSCAKISYFFNGLRAYNFVWFCFVCFFRSYRFQRVNQKLYIEGQTIHWPKIKGQTMIYKTLHRRTDNTMAKRQRTNNDLQNTTQDRKYNGQKTKNKQ